jgi:hypothetical protein
MKSTQNYRIRGKLELFMSIILTLKGLMATSVTEAGTQKLPQKFKVVETY